MGDLSHPKRFKRTKVSKLQVEPDVASCDEKLEEVANEFATHPDFAEARKDRLLWDSTSLDGLTRSTR